jgi:hypothetical protein
MYAVLDFTWKPTADSTSPPAGKAPALIRNDPFDHKFRVTAGWADLGTEEFEAQFRTARLTGSTAGTPAAQVEVETEQDGVDLLIHFHLDAADTTALAAALFFDCQMVGGSTIVAGKAKVLDDVTRFV